MIASGKQRTVHGILYEYSPAQYLTSTVSWTTKQQALQDEALVTIVSSLKVKFEGLGAIGDVVELIGKTSWPGKAPDDVEMLLDEALYPSGDTVLLLSQAELIQFSGTLE